MLNLNFPTVLDIVATALVFLVTSYLLVQDGQPVLRRFFLALPWTASIWNMGSLIAGYRVDWSSEPTLTAAIMIALVGLVVVPGAPLVIRARTGWMVHRVSSRQDKP